MVQDPRCIASPDIGARDRSKLPHRPGYSGHLVVAGALNAALTEVGKVGAGHDSARGPLEVGAALSAAVRATVGVQRPLEPPCCVQNSHLLRRSRSYNLGSAAFRVCDVAAGRGGRRTSC